MANLLTNVILLVTLTYFTDFVVFKSGNLWRHSCIVWCSVRDAPSYEGGCRFLAVLLRCANQNCLIISSTPAC